MPSKRQSYQSKLNQFLIPEKANRVLNLILILMLLIILRIWHLTVVQYESKLEESRKPQRRIVVEAARRATIRDRFNIPLAINKVQYNAAILYSQLKQIPSVSWKKDQHGKKIKVLKRKEYISTLSNVLAEELQLDSERLQDLIHAKASYYFQIPFIIKEEISEKEYYRLKMLEKDWLGIHVQRIPKRTYPLGRVAADLIGYMGAINRQEYESIIEEMKELESYLVKHEEGEDLPPLPKGMKNFLQVRKRWKDLQEKAYAVTDYVGKTGIEGRFEDELRGYQGKKSYYSDARGNFLKELPGSNNPTPGKRLLLSISAELQEYAEQLLIQNEQIREAQISNPDPLLQAKSSKQPWIKGGAIVAMDPYNGEILALATHPRFDPNDFIASGNSELNARKSENISRWFESEEYLGLVWDQKRSLERELWDPSGSKGYYDEALRLSWDRYLEFILPSDSIVKAGLTKINNIKNAIALQKNVETLLLLSGQNNLHWLLNSLYTGEEHNIYGKVPLQARETIENCLKQNCTQVAQLKKKIDPYLENIPHNYDKVLLVDLCRLAVPSHLFSEDLVNAMGGQTFSLYRDLSAAMASISPVVRQMCKTLFHEHDFKTWRKENEKEFLKQKRDEEKMSLRYPKPYIDYLDAMEQSLFSEFWNMHRWRLILAFLKGVSMDEDLKNYVDPLANWHWELSQGAHQELAWRHAFDLLKDILAKVPEAMAIPYLQTLRSFHELDRPLFGHYRHLRKSNGQQLEKHLAEAFYPLYGFGYGRSYAYRQSATQGSLFKLITAYEALIQRFSSLGNREATVANLNPLSMVDIIEKHGKDLVIGYDEDGNPIPQHYKGGRIPKSCASHLGKLDLLKALEDSSNPYFSLLAGDVLKSPDDLAKAARRFSYGQRTGIDLPAEIPGKIPEDLNENRTGLYSMAIGQHSLVVTPLQTAVMLSTIANGGKVLKPKIVSMIASAQSEEEENTLFAREPPFAFKESLALAGIDFPLFTAIAKKEQKNLLTRIPTEIKQELFMPEIIRGILLEGMHRVVSKLHQNGLTSLSRLYHNYPEAIGDFVRLKDQLAGKTSTSESMESIDIDLLQGTNKYTHVWFGGIAFDNHEKGSRKSYLFRDSIGQPELVVVVYLRFGKYGKESAPLAAQIIQKWREIKEERKLSGGYEDR